ncbi:XRE family transcriptional regulator [Tunicatimonas pelagia]|uniref:XRE family transcriptional regulator n=1 Tax=Tunicatimonas pelagia TaxID=931531 RepID=UPI0026652E24|nr:helix-turn-helix domain-containing protein [Tunicatimonas pelagia]WKN43313.1 helix-turn-helix domain-containing protein [Tunicatimonas pelagia]
MSIIGKNIKTIRTIKNISQAEFADIFDISRASIGAYEEGRADPKLETIINIANYFSISIDTLLTKALSVAELREFDILDDKKPLAEKSDSDRDLSKEDTPLVKRGSYVEYIVNYQNKDYINRLPYVRLPDTQHYKSRAFEVQHDAMEVNRKGLLKGDILSCSPIALSEKKKLVKDGVYVVVTEEDIFVRRYDHADEQLYFRADNPNYETLQIQRENILELWKVMGFFSTVLKPPIFLEERVALLERKLNDLEQRFISD